MIRVNVNCDVAVHFYCYCNDFYATTMEGGILQMLLLIHEIKIKSDDLGSCLQTVFLDPIGSLDFTLLVNSG